MESFVAILALRFFFIFEWANFWYKSSRQHEFQHLDQVLCRCWSCASKSPNSPWNASLRLLAVICFSVRRKEETDWEQLWYKWCMFFLFFFYFFPTCFFVLRMLQMLQQRRATAFGPPKDMRSALSDICKHSPELAQTVVDAGSNCYGTTSLFVTKACISWLDFFDGEKHLACIYFLSLFKLSFFPTKLNLKKNHRM